MNREHPIKIDEIGVPEHLLPLASVLGTGATPEIVCPILAEVFGVQSTEVALLRLEQNLLRFLYPQFLRTTGAIPISSSAVAAHTALSKTAEIFNNFALVKHARIFENIRPPAAGASDQPALSPIQKLMSAPIVGPDRIVVGVIQVSHKGPEPRSTLDFTRANLRDLEFAAQLLAMAFFLS